MWTLLLAAALMLAPSASGQQARRFYACYVPEVGAIYLIQIAGLPESCLSASHVEISWSEVSGEVADGSITTAKLADGAVTDVKLAADVGIRGWELVVERFDLPGNDLRSVLVWCPVGKVVLGGGFDVPTHDISVRRRRASEPTRPGAEPQSASRTIASSATPGQMAERM